MALSQVQRQQCRRYTGRTRINAQVNRELEAALNAVDALDGSDPAVATQVQADIATILGVLVVVDAQIADHVAKRSKFTKAEDVTFAGPQELGELRSYGRQMVGRLCNVLGLPPGPDVFAAAPASMGGLTRIG